MTDIGRASTIARDSFPYKAGAYYGAADGMSLGVGLIYENVRYPLYDEDSRAYDTVEGLVYVLTHECDVADDNDRAFNEYVLICPIIPFGAYIDECAGSEGDADTLKRLPQIAGDRVYRVAYLPEGNGPLNQGGLIYLNQICNTHVQEFKVDGVKPVCALSEYAQSILDKKIENHFLRPKAERLPITR